MAVRKPRIPFFPASAGRNNRSFNWFAIGEKESREKSRAENPPLPRIDPSNIPT